MSVTGCSQMNEGNQNNVTHETNTNFRNKKRNYLTDELMSLKQTVRTEIPQICTEE